MLPLADLTVVSLEQAVAAPFATRQLADLGARVIKVERPGRGDFARHYDRTVNGLSSHFVWVNRSKESLTLNLKTDEGKAILEALLAQADVFVQNLAPGAAERLGFGGERLLDDYPTLIVCNISGYGSDGPYREKKAYDLLIQAEVGLLSVTGTEETPSKAGISVADIAGGMYAFSGILAALYQRQQTGQGTVLDVSLFDGLCEWMGFPAYYASGGAALPRTGASHAAIAPYGPFPTGDGRTVMLGIQNEREWIRFCEVVLAQPDAARDPRFAGNAQRVEHRAVLHELIEAVFAQLTLAEITRRLDAAGIANAELRAIGDFWQHPQLTERGRIGTISTPAGPVMALQPPLPSKSLPTQLDAVPALGAHTDSILCSLGYTRERIATLREQGVI